MFQQLKLFFDLGDPRAGMIVGLSCQQGISLGPKRFSTHEVQRELLVENFRTKNIALAYTVALPHRRGGSRFHDPQLAGDVD
ncbi:hypothetical protein D3C81_1181280 [compost metagenome]